MIEFKNISILDFAYNNFVKKTKQEKIIILVVSSIGISILSYGIKFSLSKLGQLLKNRKVNNIKTEVLKNNNEWLVNYLKNDEEREYIKNILGTKVENAVKFPEFSNQYVLESYVHEHHRLINESFMYGQHDEKFFFIINVTENKYKIGEKVLNKLKPILIIKNLTEDSSQNWLETWEIRNLSPFNEVLIDRESFNQSNFKKIKHLLQFGYLEKTYSIIEDENENPVNQQEIQVFHTISLLRNNVV